MYLIRFILDGVKFEIVPDGEKEHPRQLEESRADVTLDAFRLFGGPTETDASYEDEDGNVIEDWNRLTSDDPLDRWPSDLVEDDDYELPEFQGGDDGLSTESGSTNDAQSEYADLFPGAESE